MFSKFNKKIFLLILILLITFNNIFCQKNSNSILFVGDGNSHLFVLDYINGDMLMKNLKI